MAELILKSMENLEIKRLRPCFGVKEARQKKLEVRFPLLERSREILSMEDFMSMENLGLIRKERNLYCFQFTSKNLHETHRLTLKSLNEI